MGETDAARQGREMREHEREARERDPQERDAEGADNSAAGTGPDPGDEAGPPGNVQRGSTTST